MTVTWIVSHQKLTRLASAMGELVIFAGGQRGIGIDPKLVERIFAIFQHLHTRQDQYFTLPSRIMVKSSRLPT
jgi:light-regulated signal transduction histidine kinase (bacteriophytochrome)